MSVSYEGIGNLVMTMPAGNCVVGQMCMVNEQGKVDVCGGGSPFCGLVKAVKDGWAAVQIEGFVTVGCNGGISSPGYCFLASDNKGGVREDPEGRLYLVVAVDTVAKKVTFKL